MRPSRSTSTGLIRSVIVLIGGNFAIIEGLATALEEPSKRAE